MEEILIKDNEGKSEYCLPTQVDLEKAGFNTYNKKLIIVSNKGFLLPTRTVYGNSVSYNTKFSYTYFTLKDLILPKRFVRKLNILLRNDMLLRDKISKNEYILPIEITS